MALKDINTTPTSGMKSEAKKGLAWRKEHGRGGTEVSIKSKRYNKRKFIYIYN